MQLDRTLIATCKISISVVVLALSLSICYGLITDDYLFIRIYELQQNGDSLSKQLIETFAFFPSPTDNLNAIAKGFSPTNWFTDLNVKQHFFRPLPALTHYIDYLAGSQPWLMHLHNFFYIGLFFLLLWKLLGLLNLEEDARWLFVAFFFVDSATLWSGWIAQRNVLMTLVAVVASLTCFLRYQTSGKPGYYVATLILIVVSLACSEAGIVISVFLFFTPLLNGHRLLSTKHILQMLPVAILCMLYIALYQHLGFGVSHHPFYINPITDPSTALTGMIIKLPAFVLSSLGFVPAETVYFLERIVNTTSIMLMYGVLNLMVISLVIASWLYIRGPFKQLYCYGIACTTGAFLPLMASMTADRSGNFIKLGIAMALCACIMQMANSDEPDNRSRRIFKAVSWLLMAKALFSLTAAIAWGAFFMPSEPIIQPLKNLKETPKHIVYLKVHDYYFTSYLLEKIHFHHDRKVETAQRLIADNGEVILERIDADSITMTAGNNGYLLDRFDLPMEPANFAVGNTYSAGFMNITVLKEQQGLPQSLQIDFSIPPESITFLNFNGKNYEQVRLPNTSRLIL